jgi:hypothetical protein
MPVTFSGNIFLIGVRGSAVLDRVTAEVVEEKFDAVFASAVRGWPVDTGFSKAELSRQYGRVNSRVWALLRGRAPYTLWIRRGATWQTLIVDAGMKALRECPAAIGERLVRELARGN